MTRKLSTHIHRYKKINLSLHGEYYVYKCMKPTCEHYVPIKLADGKLCECNRCFEPMIIGKIQLTGSNNKPMTKPHCNKCIKRKKEDEFNKISDFISKKDGIVESDSGIKIPDDED